MKIKYQSLQALKIDLSQVDIPSYFVLVVREPEDTVNDFRSFYLVYEDTDFAKYMFSCVVKDDENAVDIATSNAVMHLPEATHDVPIYCKNCHWGYEIEIKLDKKVWRCGNPSHNTEEFGFCHRAERKKR